MYPGSDPQRQFGGWMKKIAVVGLGYVGLPLAVAFGEKREVVGFDINAGRIAELKDGVDFTREVSREELAAANKLSFTDSLDGIADCQVYIVTVPTPIDEFKTPDRKSTRLNSSHVRISYAVFCLKKKITNPDIPLSI